MNRLFVGLGGISAGLAVALGAFAAHVLKEKISASALETWQTAAHYHLIHAVVLVMVGFACAVSGVKLLRTAGWLFLIGQLVFGGSLYLLVLTDTKWLGATTPLGGICMILGWLCIAVVGFKPAPGRDNG